MPQTRNKPFHKAPAFKIIRQLLRRLDAELASKIHICVYAAPFGVVPLELDEVYPLSQHDVALPLDLETIDYVANQTAGYIKRTAYACVVLLNEAKLWEDTIERECKSACEAKGLVFDSIDVEERSKEILGRLENILRKQLSE
jgi:predicted RNA-binding protein